MKVEPQVFSLLACLIENRDRVVTKDEVIEMVWDGRIVSDGTLNSRINLARKAVGDDGKAQAVIKTFPRRGFRFVAEVVEVGKSKTMTPANPAVADRPSIAVMPFANLSGDPEQEYFSDGIAEDIITTLSRFSWLMVIARGSTFTYKGKATDVRQIAEEQGVRYVLEGSVRKAHNRVRISVQLVDGINGNDLWAETYDRELEDIFAVQDEITRTVVGAVEPELGKAERYKATIRQPDSLTAWEIYQRGMWHYYQPGTPENRDQAEALFLEAIEHDENFLPPYVGLVNNSHIRVIQGWSKRSNETEVAMKYAQKALELDATDADAHSCLASVFMAKREHARAIKEGKIAISLNPSSILAHTRLGASLAMSGEYEAAIPVLEMALRLSPNDPDTCIALARLAEAYMGLGRFEAAAENGELAAAMPRRGIWIHTAHVATLAHAGRVDDAKQALLDLFDRAPNFTCAFLKENFPATDPHLIEVYVDGLRKAGVPER